MVPRILVTAFTAIVMAVPVLAEDVEIKTTHVAGHVYVLEGYGGNIGVSVGDDGILLVDDQFANIADKIRAALAAVKKGDVSFILNTHFHGDHTGGNTVFGHEAVIIAHDNVRQRLSTPQQMWGETRDPMDAVAWPVVTFDEAVSVHFNGEEIKLFHLPNGHTDGDALVYFTGSNVLHMGDLLFSGIFPYVDLEHGGTVEGFVANQEKVLAMGLPADVKVIAGHGPLSTLDHVRDSVGMIRATTALIRKEIDAGKSLEDIQKAGLPETFASWDWSFITTDRWIETIWNTYAE